MTTQDSTPVDGVVSEAATETGAAASLGMEIASLATGTVRDVPREHDLAGLAAVVPNGFRLAFTPLDQDTLRDRPRSTSRDVKVYDLAAFARYVARHHVDGDLEVYADPTKEIVTAILDAPSPGQPSWETHDVTLVLIQTAAWKRWLASNGQWMSQGAFADLLETGLPEVIVPDAVELLDLASTFSARTTVEFDQGVRLQSGETLLTYRERTTSTAGSAGQMELPKEIMLALSPWTASPQPWKITARLRWKIKDKQLALCYILDRVEELVENAFGDIVTGVEANVPVEVFTGKRPG